MGEVGGEDGVHTTGDETVLNGFVDDEVGVEVFEAKARVERDVGRVRGVAGFWDPPTVVFQRLSGVSRGIQNTL